MPRSVSEAIGTAAATSGRYCKREGVTSAQQTGEQQTGNLTYPAQGLQRTDARVPLLWWVHLDDEHVRYSICCGKAEAEHAGQHGFEREAQINRDQQQRKQCDQHATQKHLSV
jgi:hypothetical protein